MSKKTKTAKPPKTTGHVCDYQAMTVQLMAILAEIVPLLNQVQHALVKGVARVEELADAPKRKKPTPKRSRP